MLNCQHDEKHRYQSFIYLPVIFATLPLCRQCVTFKKWSHNLFFRSNMISVFFFMDTYSQRFHCYRVNLKGPLKNIFYMSHMRNARNQSSHAYLYRLLHVVVLLVIYVFVNLQFLKSPIMTQRLENVCFIDLRYRLIDFLKWFLFSIMSLGIFVSKTILCNVWLKFLKLCK